MERPRPAAAPDFASGPADDLRPSAFRLGPLAETAGAAGEPETVAEAEAREVWRVAARLQAEAARRLDARSQAIAGEHRPAAQPAAFSRAEVEEIAQSAGIDPSFVALAWREVAAARHQRPVSDDRQRRASAFLGTDAERLAVTRVFRASPDAVLAAMQRVFPTDPYQLTLVDVIGEADDLTDTALLFDVPQVMAQSTKTGGYTPFSYAMSVSTLTRAVVTLHDLGDGRTEATVAVDLRHSKSRNLTAGSWLTGGMTVALGVLGGLLGGAVGDGGLAAALGATAGASGSGALTYLAYRMGYQGGLGKGERALGELLSTVEVDLRSGGAFRSPPAPSPRPPDGRGVGT